MFYALFAVLFDIRAVSERFALCAVLVESSLCNVLRCAQYALFCAFVHILNCALCVVLCDIGIICAIYAVRCAL